MAVMDFLAENKNTLFCEDLFNHCLLYDLKLASIEAKGQALLSYNCEVDHDGFDVILDDRDNLKKIQLKTSSAKSSTESWAIHRNILRPPAFILETLGFEPCVPWGVGGGVLLIVYDMVCNKEQKRDRLVVEYYYSDILVITAIALGMLSRKSATIEAAKNLRANLFKGMSNDKIDVAFGLFIKAATPRHLLALIGLQHEFHGDWRNIVLKTASGKWEAKSPVSSKEVESHIKCFTEDMRQFCGHDSP